LCPELRRVSPLVLAALLLTACTSGQGEATRSAGDGGQAVSAAGVVVATIEPEPTRAPAPTTTPPAAATLGALHVPEPTVTPTPPPATESPTETATPGLSATPPLTPTPSLTPTPTATLRPGELTQREQALLEAHNAERAARGIPLLTVNPVLQEIARERARIMARNNLFSHYSPTGETVYDMLDEAGYAWNDATENIHYNNVAESQSGALAMSHYMASPAHRANILKAGFRRVGVAVETNRQGVHYFSVVFSD
jgi:uncharacterized protein YkwD